MNVRKPWLAVLLCGLLGAGGSAQASLVVVGRLLDADQRPLGAAVVGLRDDASTPTADVLAAPRATVDAEGRFQLAVERPQTGAVRLVVAAPGCATVELVPTPDLGDVVLPRGVAIVGSVRDAAGGLLAGVDVIATDALRRVGPLRGIANRRAVPTVTARTDARGLFRMTGVLGQAAALEFEKAGFAPASVAPYAFGDPIVVELRAIPVVRGRVLDADGRPVRATLGVRTDSLTPGITRSTLAAADGAFVVGVPEHGAFRIVGSARVDGELQAVEHGPMEGTADGLVLTLERPRPVDRRRPLRVEVVAADGGAAIEAFRAAVVWNPNPAGMVGEFLQRTVRERLVDGRAGHVELPAPQGNEPTTGAVFVGAPGRAWTRVDAIEWSDGPDARPARVALPVESVLTGRVVDPATGEGVGGARIVWLPESGNRARYMRVADRMVSAFDEVRSAEDGAFELRGLPAGPVEVLVHVAGRPPIEAVHLALDAGEERALDAPVAVPRGATVRGALRGLAQAGGVRVEARAIQADPRANSALATGNGGAVAADGSFEIGALGAGFYVLDLVVPCSPRGGPDVRIPLEPLRVRPGAADVAIAIDVGGDLPGSIRGRITVRGGALPRSRLAVVAEDEARQQFVNAGFANGALALPSADGGFELPAAAGSYRVRVFDVASGVEVARAEGVRLDPARTVECEIAAEVVPLDVRLRFEGAVVGTERLEIAVDWPQPKTAGGLVVFDGGGDSGIGVDVRDGRIGDQLFLPALATRLRLWSGPGGTDEQPKKSAPLVERELTPARGDRLAVELVVPAQG